MNDPRAALDGLGLTVRSLAPLGGAHRAELADGRTVVAKSGAPGQAATEAAGLRWLAVPGGPPLPEVIAVDERWLCLLYTSDAADE